MKQPPLKIKKIRKKNSIDEMESLLNQIYDFKNLIETTKNISDPAFKQEYGLFKQHVEWVIEDLGQTHHTQNAYIKSKVS